MIAVPFTSTLCASVTLHRDGMHGRAGATKLAGIAQDGMRGGLEAGEVSGLKQQSRLGAVVSQAQEIAQGATTVRHCEFAATRRAFLH